MVVLGGVAFSHEQGIPEPVSLPEGISMSLRYIRRYLDYPSSPSLLTLQVLEGH